MLNRILSKARTFARDIEKIATLSIELYWGSLLNSAFHLHNQTFNFWTHFLGLFYFVYLGLTARSYLLKQAFLLAQHEDDLKQLNIWPIYMSLLSFCICLLFSSIYHLFECKSKWCFENLCLLDYIGILSVGCSLTLTLSFYYFNCWFYTKTSFVLAALITNSFGLFLIFQKNCHQVDQNSTRAFIFSFFLGGQVAAFVSIFVLHIDIHDVQIDWFILTKGVLLYFLAFLTYSKRFPECLFKEKFDLIGSSHQLFHILILLAFRESYYFMTDFALKRMVNFCTHYH